MGPPEFVGWYEPHHDLLEHAAGRFAERMGDSTWMLATPQGAVFWNGMLLRIGRPAAKEHEQAAHAFQPEAPCRRSHHQRPTEALWLAYYASAFNGAPAPVPLRYWRMPPAGPPLPARLARERSRLGAQSAPSPSRTHAAVEYSAMTPPLQRAHRPAGHLPALRVMA